MLLLDTYDTEAAAKKVVALAPALKASGIAIRGVRLDSGDLIALSKSVRTILDHGGLQDVTIFASGGLDEDALAAITNAHAPIDGFGIGTSLTTSSDVPAIDCVYKLQEYAGLARRKRSEKKATWPGSKQVWRHYDANGCMMGDLISLDRPAPPGPARGADSAGTVEPLIQHVMRDGRRLARSPSLDEIRLHTKRALERLPEGLRRLEAGGTYPVKIGDDLVGLAGEVDERMRRH